MINKNEKLLSEFKNKFNDIEIKNICLLGRYFFLEDKFNILYILIKKNKRNESLYYTLKEKKLINSFRYKDTNNEYYLFEISKEVFDTKAKSRVLFNKLLQIFEIAKMPISIKKDDVEILSNAYKVLDTKFTYLEMRIREIELKPNKLDEDWVLLSKYHYVLDCKVWLYDIQQKLFDILAKDIPLTYGIVFNDFPLFLFDNDKITFPHDFSYQPISTLLARFFVTYDDVYIENNLISILKQEKEPFYLIHFMFLVNYIYIVALNIPINLSFQKTENYIRVINKIILFREKYYKFFKEIK